MTGTAAALAMSLAEPPPEAMRARVLAAIESTPQEGAAPAAPEQPAGGGRRFPAMWTAVAVAAVAAVAVLSFTVLRATDPVDDVLAAPDAVETAAVATEDGTGMFTTATVVHSAEQGESVLLVEGLAPVDEDRTYELWVIEGESVSPAGLFVPDDDGSVRTLIDGTVAPGAVVAVTEEPAGGMDAPTGAVLFAAEIEA